MLVTELICLILSLTHSDSVPLLKQEEEIFEFPVPPFVLHLKVLLLINSEEEPNHTSQNNGGQSLVEQQTTGKAVGKCRKGKVSH